MKRRAFAANLDVATSYADQWRLWSGTALMLHIGFRDPEDSVAALFLERCIQELVRHWDSRRMETIVRIRHGKERVE